MPSTPASTPGSDTDNVALYTQARALLEEMVRVGNPASSDHRALLVDVEELVDKVSARRRNWRPTNEETHLMRDTPFSPGTFFDGFMDEQAWNEMAWENLLEGWPGGWNTARPDEAQEL